MHEQKRYPHLLPADANVLTAYLKIYGARYKDVQFDVRVGEGRDPGDSVEPNIRKMAIDISQRRIDAVGSADGFIDLIEVTQDAGTTAVGQLYTYPTLFQQTYHPTKALRRVLVTERVQSDITPILAQMGVEVFTFPNANP